MAAQKESRGKPEKEKGFQGKASEDNSGANYSTVKCDFQVKGSSFNVRCKRGARKKSPKTRRGPGKKKNASDKCLRGSQDHHSNAKTSLESSSTTEIDQEPQCSATDPIEEMEKPCRCSKRNSQPNEQRLQHKT
uniref:Uncharacterized protein n=1 Tax=Salix viminalis TaxID=40686 RepID=A0A6N2LQM0_SALVM